MSRFVSTGSARGLSPRGRGNQHKMAPLPLQVGSIPAWAGQPLSTQWHGSPVRVYPRVGGATTASYGSLTSGDGLSPRGRGNRGAPVGAVDRLRSIPAWAGQPARWRCGGALLRVYPRVGGATAGRREPRADQRGLSPRGRGNHGEKGASMVIFRSIPAWAGQPASIGAVLAAGKVYPRVGGATPISSIMPAHSLGLSPRGRGNPGPDPRGRPGRRSIPAWAGQPTRHGTSSNMVKVYPRVGGATSSRTPTATGISGLSPRGRGNRTAWPTVRIHARSIPAWAGQPLAKLAVGGLLGVYPRVGGATPDAHRRAADHPGLSPRGRGNRAKSCRVSSSSRSIPARAGQPSVPVSVRMADTVYPREGGATF